MSGFRDETVDMDFDCPLDLHCSYTRDRPVPAKYLRETNKLVVG